MYKSRGYKRYSHTKGERNSALDKTDQKNVLNDFGGEEDEYDDEDETLNAVVHVVERRTLHRHERRGRQDRREHDEQCDVAGDGAVLHLQAIGDSYSQGLFNLHLYRVSARLPCTKNQFMVKKLFCL